MVRCAIDNRLEYCWHFKVAIVDGHSPDVDTHVQCQVQHLMQWEQEHINMVWRALQKTVDGMKCMTGVWSWYFPRMMRLVYVCIDKAMVKSTVNPVDEAVSEKDEGKHGHYHP